MDGRGGCCIARYAGGGGGGVYDMSKVDRIMLRYRPIAPKPAAGGSLSGADTPPQKSEVPARTGRWKRRYVKDNNKNSNSSSNKRSSSGSSTPSSRKRKAASPEESESTRKTVSNGETVVTLPLLSESPERKDSPTDHSVKKTEKKSPIWLSFGGNQGRPNIINNNNDINGQLQLQGYGGGVGMDRSVGMFPQPVRVVGSWVKVESVTDAWLEGYGLGCTDEEKLVNLERDTCPGFISDGLNRVQWANKAYKEMVGDGGSTGEVVVWLVMKDDVRLPESKNTAAFTCKVRVVRCGKEKNSLILPCDVWRMDGGGFAWRLDTEAALSLGR